MSDKQPLIIISDYGLDDACALAYLLEYAGRFGGIDVVCVAGNAPAEQSLVNAQKLLDNQTDSVKNSGCPVRLVNTNGIAQNFACLPSIHGKDGMGDLFAVPKTVTALDYNEWVKKLPQSAVVLSLGPCTVALDIVQRITNPQLIMMAGVVSEQPNHLGMEFNEALDPESFTKLLGYPHKTATLDTCRAAGFNLIDAAFTDKSLLSVLTNRAIELARLRHPDNAYVYDLITALYLIVPEIFSVHAVTDARGNRINELKLKHKKFQLKDYLNIKP